MSGFFIALEKEIPGFDPYTNGNSISRAFPILTKIAKQLGVKELLEFFSQDPNVVEDFMEGEGVDAEDFSIPPQRYFAAEDGLATIERLITYLSSNPKEIKNFDKVMAELTEWRNVLNKAKEHGVRWHMDVDI